MAFGGFGRETFRFLGELEANNEREWFAENKHRYESQVLEPALAFIEACAAPLARVSPHFRAVAKRQGGSLMRVYRDTRFGKDKRPYKTNIGIHFRHALGRDVHAPGFYVHIEPGQCFLGAGIWHPERGALNAIRMAIDEESARWKKLRDARAFTSAFELGGDSLKRPPRGFDETHPLIDDLRRKDFIAICNLDGDEAMSAKLPATVTRRFKAASGLVHFLCDAIDVPFEAE